MLDASFRVLDVNCAWERMTGKPRTEVVGREVWEVLPGTADPAAPFWREFHRAGEQRVARHFQAAHPPAGSWATMCVQPRAEGGIAVVVHELGAGHAAEQPRDAGSTEAEALYETAPVGLCVLDADLRWVRLNQQIAVIDGVPRRDHLGKTPREVLRGGMGEQAERALRRVLEGTVPRLEFDMTGATFARPDDRRFWRGRAVPLRDERGKLVGVSVAVEDVTDHERAASAAREGEAGLLRVKERLEEVDRRKNEFLAVLSHELRNPLAPILNGIYILERTGPATPQARHAMRVIERQARQMTRLVDDLLDVTRISRGKLRLGRERVDLCALVRGTVEDHRGTFAASGVELLVALPVDPLWVEGDPTRLAQVVGNLLGNAVKFTPPGGRTEVSVERAPADWAALRVRDNGIGMPVEALARVFEPFVQAERAPDRTVDGLGLGLALVKGLVELHCGTVVARSEGPGRGAEFVVRLPLERRRESRNPAPAPRRAGFRPRVLLIEDSVDAAETLKEALEMGHHEVVVARTGTDGLEAARRSPPDVVLCDIGLPGIDGYAVARALRAEPALSSVPLVALSGHGLPEDVERSRQAGFDEHVVKPPDIEELERVLAGLGPPAPRD